MKTRKGIIAGGNWIVDFIKLIDVYPEENALANILEEKTGNGGAPFNVLKALHKMGVSFPLEGIGMVGDDEEGKEVLAQCGKLGIDITRMKIKDGTRTSFTDVMTVVESGRRTFFHHRGASAHLGVDDFELTTSGARIFHLGYLLLLDELDRVDAEGRSGASRVFEAAHALGFLTSADIVSEQSDRYQRVVPSSLPFIDILFLNELEARGLTGVDILGENGLPLIDRAEAAGRHILTLGVRKWVVFHFPAGALAMGKEGPMIGQPAVNLPASRVMGTVGAGDALAAGVLAALHEGRSMAAALRSGVCVAAASLLSPNASDGILPWGDCLSLGNQCGFLHH